MNPKDYADHLIDVYLSGLTSISNDAGWEGDSLMARLIEFHGEIPESTGNVQSNLSMVNAIEKLRNKHALFDSVRRVVGSMLATYGENDKILALLSRRYYQGNNPQTGQPYKISDRISLIGHAPSGISDPTDASRQWETAERYYRERCTTARNMLLDKMEKLQEAA